MKTSYLESDEIQLLNLKLISSIVKLSYIKHLKT